MLHKYSIGAAALAAALCLSLGARADDVSKYPNWEGMWKRGSPVGVWDPTKPPGLGQQPPLTAEYQAVIAVGTLITERPPHRSERARFGHSAPTAGV
jgi:hypothetical protein